MHVHATVAGVEMHARARATGKATPAAIYSYSRNALPVLVRDGSDQRQFTLWAHRIALLQLASICSAAPCVGRVARGLRHAAVKIEQLLTL